MNPTTADADPTAEPEAGTTHIRSRELEVETDLGCMGPTAQAVGIAPAPAITPRRCPNIPLAHAGRGKALMQSSREQCRFLTGPIPPRGIPRVFNAMKLRRPDIQALRHSCERGTRILISAPFYSQEGLNWVRPNPGGHVEFWTRFNPRDWAAGVSDPPALLRYLEKVGEDRVSLRVHRALHAKIYQVDTTWSWIGSPNLSRAAFTSNIELVAELDAEETESLGNFVNDLRVSLRDLTVADLRAYIETCKDTIPLDDSDSWKNEDFQAAVELADEYLSPPSALAPTVHMPPLSDFISFIDGMHGDVPRTIRDHYHNTSRQNRQGHLKQSYYALVHFLSDSTGRQYTGELLDISLNDYPHLSSGFVDAWVRFLDANAKSKDVDLDYSFSTLRNVLPERIGGYVTNGGGGIGTFTRMAPLVARFLSR